MVANGIACVEKGFATCSNFAVDRAGHFVARGEFRLWVVARHEALAIFADQRCAFTTQGLSRKWRRVEANIHSGGMELDKFRICDHCACTVSHGERVASGLRWVGCNPEQSARAACAKDGFGTGKG